MDIRKYFHMDLERVSMSQEWSRVASAESQGGVQQDFWTFPFLTTQKLKVILSLFELDINSSLACNCQISVKFKAQVPKKLYQVLNYQKTIRTRDFLTSILGLRQESKVSRCCVSVCESGILFKRSLKMSSSSILKSPGGFKGKEATKQKKSSRQALWGHTVRAMLCRGLFQCYIY